MAFSLSGVTEGFLLWSGCRAARGDDTGCSPACPADAMRPSEKGCLAITMLQCG